MTTLSSLIGPANSSFGLGESVAPPRASLWQRLGGAFRRKGEVAESPAASNNAATLDAPIEALKQVVDDTTVMTYSDDDESLSDSIDEQPSLDMNGPSLVPPTPPRRRLLWGGKRDAAMDEVRNGIGALASLLNGIQEHLENQGARQDQFLAQQDQFLARQDQLIACLTHLPQASAAQAQAAAAQTQSLAAIRDQMAQGSANQARLSAALERLGGLQETTGAALDRLGNLQEGANEALGNIGRRVEQMDVRDASFAASMEKVCDAMQTVSRASETGAVVLERVQHTLTTHEDGINRTLDKHQNKFNALMAVAIAVSAAALAVVAGVGYMVLSKMH